MEDHEDQGEDSSYERMLLEESSDEEDEFLHLQKNLLNSINDSAYSNTNLVATTTASATVAIADEMDGQWGGSQPGRAANLPRDFQGASRRLRRQYFSGADSIYNESHFERRFRMPRSVFDFLWNRIKGIPPFVQTENSVTKKPGIDPLVRFVASSGGVFMYPPIGGHLLTQNIVVHPLH